jgi:hypothetical protein
MRKQPGEVEDLEVDWGITGATLGVTVLQGLSTVITARQTGFTETPAGSGIYVKASYTFPSPTTTAAYRLLYDDDGGTAALGHVAIEELIISNAAPGDPLVGDTYGTTDELFRRLKVRTPTAEQEAQGDLILLMATTEINDEIDLTGDTDLSAGHVAIATEVCYKRAVELWAESPFGLLGLENAEFAVRTTQDSWKRYAYMLSALKQQWGFA